jgi:hypothetical protein
MKNLHVLILTVLFLVLTACAASTATPPATTVGTNPDVAVPTTEAPTVPPTESNPTATTGGEFSDAQSIEDESILQNMEYKVASLDNAAFTLTDGLFEDREAMIYVSYIRTEAYADVNGDGKEDAIVLLGANTGGSGIFTDLAIVATDESNQPINIATVMLGDRVDVRDLTIEDGNILVTMVTQGPNEPMCCGTLEVTVTYALEGETLTEVARTENGYLNGVENFYYPETFNNMTIHSTVMPSGTVTLTAGRYENESDRIISVLETDKIQYGDLNGDGKDEAILLLHSNTGGSGTFTELVVAGAADNQVFDIATTLLGDRVTVYSVMVTDTDHILIDMLTQGAEDPFCCPTSRIHAEYVLNGDTLENVNVTEIETIPPYGSSGLGTDSVTVDISGVADSIEGVMVPYYPIMEGPGLSGTPEHLLYGFNGESVESFAPMYPQLRVFPVAQYQEMYDKAGISAISDYLANLQDYIAQQSTELPADMSQPLPFLPIFNAAQDLAANVEHLEFNNGNGYRFITHYRQAADAFLSGQVFYTFQGLTDDGQYLVVFMYPLQTDLLPATYDEVPQEVLDGIWDGTGFEEYRQSVITTLDEAANDQFAPTLDALDAMMAGMTITTTAAE